MATSDFALHVEAHIGHEPTADQQKAVARLEEFLTDGNPHSMMILRGSAGTGKTTLAGAVVRTLKAFGKKVVLLAPTGRAAKVFALNSGQAASTIHRRIYRQKSLDAGFEIGFNSSSDTIFFVDEASMVSTREGAGIFGGGSLLDDLVQFVYSGKHCRMILIGDPAQLPPVGEAEAPALDSGVLAGYGLSVYEATLDEVVRQEEASGILWNATQIRRALQSPSGSAMLPAVRFQGFADIQHITGSEVVEMLSASYDMAGEDETVVITRSNKQANSYNTGIRNSIFWREEELTTGDRLMVVKNKYLLGKKDEGTGMKEEGLSFIANGDMAQVVRVRNVRELYGFRFADVLLRFPDYNDEELQLVVMLDALHSESPALTAEQSERLYSSVLEDYADVRPKSERMKRLKEDPYFGALQVKYGYAVTCHKAQGGQWAHVYIDQGYMSAEMLTPEYIHWLYTAFTRARERLFLVNWAGRTDRY